MSKPPDSEDSYRLQRFLDAQEPLFAQVLDELRQGVKRGHWMWFVFPQLAGLGRSATARHYAISGREEAAAYLAHPRLGPRLRDCCRLVLAHEGKAAEAIFGPLDAMKFRSSMTLFAAVAGEGSPFAAALTQFFRGAGDPLTLELLRSRRDP